jgi:hypothetical protein
MLLSVYNQRLCWRPLKYTFNYMIYNRIQKIKIHAKKPNWLAFSKFPPPTMYLWTPYRKRLSSRLSVVDKRLTERKFCGNFRSLPTFGILAIFCSYQNAGKWQSRKQWIWWTALSKATPFPSEDPQSSSTLWNYSKCGVYTVESEAGC